jgi:hypothetical protein
MRKNLKGKGFIIEKLYYNKTDLQKIFGFGRDKMKKFLDKGILPTVRVNKDYLISKEELDTWFKKNAGKAINI